MKITWILINSFYDASLKSLRTLYLVFYVCVSMYVWYWWDWISKIFYIEAHTQKIQNSLIMDVIYHIRCWEQYVSFDILLPHAFKRKMVKSWGRYNHRMKWCHFRRPLLNFCSFIVLLLYYFYLCLFRITGESGSIKMRLYISVIGYYWHGGVMTTLPLQFYFILKKLNK